MGQSSFLNIILILRFKFFNFKYQPDILVTKRAKAPHFKICDYFKEVSKFFLVHGDEKRP